MSEQSQFEAYRKAAAVLITEASHALSSEKLAELLVFISEGVDANLKALSVPEEVIAAARKLYREAASTAIIQIDMDKETS